MYRLLLTCFIAVLTSVTASAHMVYVVPGNDAKSATVVFSDTLDPDERVDIQKIAGTKLIARFADGQESALAWKKGEHALAIRLPAVPDVIHGTTVYGLLTRAEEPTLLVYHPKAVFNPTSPTTTIGKKATLELVPLVKDGTVKFRLLAQGKPVPEAEGTIRLSDGSKEAITTNADGYTPTFEVTGRCAVYFRLNESKPREYQGKKYQSIRHYATLVVDVSGGKTTFPPLPHAVSSLGAVVCDGYLYVYGGHVGRTHTYSTKDVLGTFHRLKLDGGTEWEELPGGPILQGMNLATHQGKIYRVGGMSPQNAPGEPKDNVSVVECARFDPTKGEWEQLPPLPAGRSSHDVVVVEDKLVVVGGWQSRGRDVSSVWHDTAVILDLSAKQPVWRQIPQPFQRRALTAATIENKVYVLCGLDADGVAHNRVDILDLTTEKWSTGPDVPGGRIGFSPAAGVVNGRLVVNTSEQGVFRLSNNGKHWDKVGESATRRIVHRLVPWAEGCLLVGGASSSGNVTEIEVIQVPDDAPRVNSPAGN